MLRSLNVKARSWSHLTGVDPARWPAKSALVFKCRDPTWQQNTCKLTAEADTC